MPTVFDSEGFDADAASQDNQVLEIGGASSLEQTVAAAAAAAADNDKQEESDPLQESEALKQQGNTAFSNKEWLEAIDLYTAAIAACPGDFGGFDLLKDQNAWQDAENERLREEALQGARRETSQSRTTKADTAETVATKDDADTTTIRNADTATGDAAAAFVPRQHPHGAKLAVYHCNRAAAHHHQQDFTAAIQDCDVSLLLHATYIKAFVRRSASYEALEQNDKALADAKSALELSPTTPTNIRKTVKRLQKLEDERLEQLKAETMDKLKDLGNSILGNFGLSLDSFQAKQDPATGSYSISFNQG